MSKCVAITIETRPDYCLKPHLNNMLRYGCTRIEIGVQSVYEVDSFFIYDIGYRARYESRSHRCRRLSFVRAVEGRNKR